MRPSRPVNGPARPTARASWRARLADPMVGAVLALGITQITAWGTSYYCLGVLAGTDQPGHGLEPGLRLPRLHRRPARHGHRLERGGTRHRPARRARGDDARHRARVGRPVRPRPGPQRRRATSRCGRSSASACGFCLYDAAFAALVQVAPSRGRMAISYLTLFGAFASSVFWVIGHALERAGRLAADARPVRPHQSGGVPAAALARPRPARDRAGTRPPRRAAPRVPGRSAARRAHALGRYRALRR